MERKVMTNRRCKVFELWLWWWWLCWVAQELRTKYVVWNVSLNV